MLFSALLMLTVGQDYGRPPIERLPDLALKVEGGPKPLAAPLRVVVFLTHDCPIAGRMAPYLADVVNSHAKLDLFLVFPKATKLDLMSDWSKRAGLTTRALLVRSDDVRKSAKVDVVPTALLLDSAGQVLYFGRINDLYSSHSVARPKPERHDLRIAIEEAEAGKPVTLRFAPAVGCFLG